MMKLLVALALAIATASAFSPQFEQRDLKYRVEQAKLKLAEATSQINSQFAAFNVPHNALRLMNNGTEEDPCDSSMLQMSTVPKCQAEMIKQMQEDGTPISPEISNMVSEMCRCMLVPMIGAIGPMLNLMCGQDECAVLMRSLSEEESGSSSPEAFDYDTMCTKKHCFREIFDMTQDLGKGMVAPAGCPALPTMAPSADNNDDEMEEGMEAMMEGIDFYCAKNIRGEYCGKAFETAGQTVEAECGAFNSSCVCPFIASQGCCMKLAYDFTIKHEPSAAAEMQTALSACQYDVTKMVTCANSKKRQMKFVKQKLAFKKVECNKKKSEVALIVQKMVASKAQVNVGNVAVEVDSCPCCSDGSASRRLLSTGDVETTVTITGDSVDTAVTKINQAVETGSWASSDLGNSVEINQAETTDARVETQSSDIGEPVAESPASAIVPSVLVAVLMAVIATLF